MPHPFWLAVSLEPEKTFPVNVCYSQCVSASCFEFHKMFYVKKNYYLWSSFPLPLVTCMTRSSCMQSSLLCILSFLYQIMMCFVFSTFFFFFFSVFKDFYGLHFVYRFLLDFYMLELLISSGLHNAGRSYSQCFLQSANHFRESKSDLNVQTEKHWNEF